MQHSLAKIRDHGELGSAMQDRHMQNNAQMRSCDDFDRRTNPRRTYDRGALTGAMVDGGRNRRTGRGPKEGQDGIRRAPSGYPDRLRLFPHSLWKSCTHSRSVSRRFDESGEKIPLRAVEKLRRWSRRHGSGYSSRRDSYRAREEGSSEKICPSRMWTTRCAY